MKNSKKVSDAYRIIDDLRQKDKQFQKLISRIEKEIIEEKESCFFYPYINFRVRTKFDLNIGLRKILQTYLTDKYFDDLHKIRVESRKSFFGTYVFVKLK